MQISVLHALHGLRQLADRLRDRGGQLHGKQKGKYQRQRGDPEIGLVDPVLTAQQLLRVGRAHRRPARRLRLTCDIEPARRTLAGEDPAVFRSQNLFHIFLLQSRVNEVLLRVPEDAAALVDEINIAAVAQIHGGAQPVDDLVIEVDQQHALHAPRPVEHRTGDGYDPVILARDQIFHAGRRDLHLPRVRQRAGVPRGLLIAGIGIELRVCRPEQRAARLRDERNGRDLRTDLLRGSELLLGGRADGVGQHVLVRSRQVGRDHVVVHDKVGDILHILDIHVNLRVDAQDELAGIVGRIFEQFIGRSADRHIRHGRRDDEDQQHEERHDARTDRVAGEQLSGLHPVASRYCFGVMPSRRRKVSEK